MWCKCGGLERRGGDSYMRDKGYFSSWHTFSQAQLLIVAATSIWVPPIYARSHRPDDSDVLRNNNNSNNKRLLLPTLHSSAQPLSLHLGLWSSVSVSMATPWTELPHLSWLPASQWRCVLWYVYFSVCLSSRCWNARGRSCTVLLVNSKHKNCRNTHSQSF